MALDYDDLDPNIRAVVRWLNDNGFATIDSGDGKAKFTDEGKPTPEWETPDQPFDCVNPFPHVVMSVPVSDLGSECDRLRDLLIAKGLDVGAVGPDDSDIAIQGSYDPCLEDLPAYIMLMGVANTDLEHHPGQ